MPENTLAERAQKRDIESLSFEEALFELEGIVRRLEQGSAKLEESIVAYQRGEVLRKRCEKLLAKAQGEVEKITAQAEDEKDNSREKTQPEQTFSRQKLSSV